VGIEPSSPVQRRKLFISRSDKSYKNYKNAEVRYTVGTRTIRPILDRSPKWTSSERLVQYLGSVKAQSIAPLRHSFPIILDRAIIDSPVEDS
jgi:hypothetical protein